MNGRFATRYTLSDYVHASRLFVLCRWRGWKGALNLFILLAVIFSANLSLGHSESETPVRSALVATGICSAIIAALVALYFKRALPAKAQRCFGESGREGEVCTYDVTPEGFHFAAPHRTGNVAWAQIKWWTQDRRLLLLAIEPPFMIFLPLDQIDTDMADHFRRTLSASGVREV